MLLAEGRGLRESWLPGRVEALCAIVTEDFRRSPRLAELLDALAATFPGLLPDRAELAVEAELAQQDKDGLEIDQGIVAAHLLGDRRTGNHLLHAMALPTREALERQDEFLRTGELDLGVVAVHRRGDVGYVTLQNHRCLNAEDDATVRALEIAVDLVLLDDGISVGVLRGGPSTHPKWSGRRTFGSGINLSRLYDGDISLVGFFLDRELGAIEKMYRGRSFPSGPQEARLEKPWVAAVDGFAIGGGCQFLLVMDRVIAERGAYFNLPAGKEGLIPGCGNLRMPRFLGEGLTRRALLFSEDFPVDSAQGRLLVSEVVEAGELDAAVERCAADLVTTSLHSVRANRKALRIATEPTELFRGYIADYARAQAYCAHSPELIRNLERTWIARRKTT